MIKYYKKEEPFIIFDTSRTTIYDSRIGYLDLKALSLKDKLENFEIDKLIAYKKQLMINATDRKTTNIDNYQLYFNKLPTLKGIKIQNDVLTKEVLTSNLSKYVRSISGV